MGENAIWREQLRRTESLDVFETRLGTEDELPGTRWDWSWHDHDLDAAPTTFGPFARLVETWRRRGHGMPNGIPIWRAFDFTDFRGWHGRINLLETLSENSRDVPVEFRIRMMGTTFASLFGEDCTGQRVAGGNGGFEDEDVPHLRRFVQGPRIGRTAGPIDWRDREPLMVDLLYLPVSSDGARVDRLLEIGHFPGVLA